ncbi:MAG: type II toxin-antitoxin system RelE/ParE family toxin [Acetobacteraceae bacterium]|nr:type II toxin-antitoxin system RelE/ParE family toxin [Acetobacteraceae bacterium]
MNEVIWSEAALVQVDVIGAYIEQFNPMAAGDVAAALIEAGNSLAHFPHRGRAVPGTTLREIVIKAYPYIIRYRIVRDTVRILRVRHTSRQPTSP